MSGLILVTGATGYVGRRLLPLLVESGANVRILTRSADSTVPAGVTVARGDLTDAVSLKRACEGVDAVINLAAVTADRKAPSGGYDAVNADGLAHLANAAQTSGATRFIQLAGIDTVTGKPGPYLAGRRRGEDALSRSRIESIAVLRPSIMFGGTDSAFSKAMAQLISLAPVVPVPGDGKLRLQMIWVEDVVRCLMALVKQPAKRGSFSIGGPDHLSYDEMLDLVGEGIDKAHVRKIHLPLSILAVQAKLMQVLPKPPLTPAALELFQSDNVTERGAVERQFGFVPRGFAEHVRSQGLYA